MTRFFIFAAAFFYFVIFISVSAWSCACGCGVFEVGTRSMLPTHPGGMVFMEVDHLHQNKNWSGDSPSPAEANDDKKLLSDFYTVGAQYMFNRRWGISGEFPYVNRFLKTTDEDGNIEGFDHSAVGDIRIKGIYSGFSPTMDSGLTFGLKLPSGDYTYPHFDPDTAIGSGSTNFLLGAYHISEIPNNNWNAFIHAEGDQVLLHAAGYHPGTEINAVLGIYYDGWILKSVKVAPIAQLIGSHRWSDNGTFSNAPNSGYTRLLLTPGLECVSGPFHFYGEIGIPIYQYVTGNQLVSVELFKFNTSYHF